MRFKRITDSVAIPRWVTTPPQSQLAVKHIRSRLHRVQEGYLRMNQVEHTVKELRQFRKSFFSYIGTKIVEN